MVWRRTRADYLITPDAVYLGVLKETKEYRSGGGITLARISTFIAMRRDGQRGENDDVARSPELSDWKIDRSRFSVDVSGAAQLRRLSNWYAEITAGTTDAARLRTIPLIRASPVGDCHAVAWHDLYCVISAFMQSGMRVLSWFEFCECIIFSIANDIISVAYCSVMTIDISR